MSSNNTQLDAMLSRAYTMKDYPKFIKLAKRKLQRLKLSREERLRTHKLQVFRVLKALNERPKTKRFGEQAT